LRIANRTQAATSAASAELIAVSSIVTFDICGTLWKPLSGRQAVMVSHIVIAVFSVWAGAWATILNYAHIDLGWLFYVQGVLLTPAVMPIAFTVLWKKQSAYAAFFGTTGGTLCGLAGWMRESSLKGLGKAGADHTPVGCQKIYGEINITNLALPYSAISGSAPGLVLSTIITVTWTLLRESKCPQRLK
jgi:Na+/proline symporter